MSVVGKYRPRTPTNRSTRRWSMAASPAGEGQSAMDPVADLEQEDASAYLEDARHPRARRLRRARPEGKIRAARYARGAACPGRHLLRHADGGDSRPRPGRGPGGADRVRPTPGPGSGPATESDEGRRARAADQRQSRRHHAARRSRRRARPAAAVRAEIYGTTRISGATVTALG
jgi:hypothetical protein